MVSEQNRVPFFSQRGALTQLASCVSDLPCWVEVILVVGLKLFHQSRRIFVLLRLHHSRHSRQLASCVKDLGPKIFRAGLRGDVRFRVSAGQMMMLFIALLAPSW